MKTIILADNQAITANGLHFLLQKKGYVATESVCNKKELIEKLIENQNGLVILDYTLFDINRVEELLIISERFPETTWLLFSEELSFSIINRLVINENNFGILFKDALLNEIQEALDLSLIGEKYISPRVKQLQNEERDSSHLAPLTKTEKDILRLLASGQSTKDIARERNSSVHTIVTHRKNIFRKLDVNTVHEATKYALRAGLIELSEYYI